MKRMVLVAVAVMITVSGFAQKTADIGIWGGTSGYWGDLKNNTSFQTFNPNFGAFFRYNFNPRVALRAMFLTGSFSADGNVEVYPWTFEKNVQDLSVQAEINYLKYWLGDKKTPFTPYILGGIGVMYFPYELTELQVGHILQVNPNSLLPKIIDINGDVVAQEVDESVVALSLPFGFGVKTHIGKRLGVGVEYLMRKHFVDKLDNLDDPFAYSNDQGEEHVYSDTWHNNDWSAYLGVHLTYKIYLGKEACPAYDKIYKK